MEINTKYNIGDYIYYGNEDAYYKGLIADMSVIFFKPSYFIRYKVDKQFDIPSRMCGKNEIRFQEFDESCLYSSPKHLIEMQIKRCERKIEHLNDKIEELKARLEQEDGQST
jgi:hypothetical protein